MPSKSWRAVHNFDDHQAALLLAGIDLWDMVDPSTSLEIPKVTVGMAYSRTPNLAGEAHKWRATLHQAVAAGKLQTVGGIVRYYENSVTWQAVKPSALRPGDEFDFDVERAELTRWYQNNIDSAPSNLPEFLQGAPSPASISPAAPANDEKGWPKHHAARGVQQQLFKTLVLQVFPKGVPEKYSINQVVEKMLQCMEDSGVKPIGKTKMGHFLEEVWEDLPQLRK